MPRFPSSSVQAARTALGARLRELRLDAGLTGTEHAHRAGWAASKTSRIETGTTPPSSADIHTWCEICGSEAEAPDLIAASRSAEAMYVEWRRLQRSGLRRLQGRHADLYRSTRLFRVYCSNIIPGLLQTEGYAGALLEKIGTFHEAPPDTESAVDARMARSRMARRGGRRIACLIEETVLRRPVGDAEIMAGQLGYLLTAMTWPSVSIGILPEALPRALWPLEAFNVFDDSRVHVELLTASVTVTVPSEVAQYADAFETMTADAVHGREARALIMSALAGLEVG